jgi:hypothetical protein
MYKVRFEVLMAVKMSVLFWVVMPCGHVGRYQHFRGKYCLQNIGIYLQVHMALKPRRTSCVMVIQLIAYNTTQSDRLQIYVVMGIIDRSV